MTSDTVITYTWEKLTADVTKLLSSVEDDDFKPHMVVGILRGGAVPAVMISHNLKVPMEALQWSKRDFASQHFGHYIDHILKKAIRQNQRILIVDDIVDSGETLGDLQYYASKMASIEYWNNYIKFAVLWQNISCPVKADYWVNEIDREVDKRWIVFPYEVSL